MGTLYMDDQTVLVACGLNLSARFCFLGKPSHVSDSRILSNWERKKKKKERKKSEPQWVATRITSVMTVLAESSGHLHGALGCVDWEKPRVK